MEIIEYQDSLKLDQTIVLLGKFDGFHLGHQRLLKKALHLKKEYAALHPGTDGLKVVIFTFDIYPGRILAGMQPVAAEHAASAVRTIDTRRERFMDLVPDEVDYIVEFPFNKETMAIEPEQFVKDILVDKLDVRKIVCGTDFRFGRKRRGDVQMLEELGKQYGFEVFPVSKVTIPVEEADGTVTEQEISSTRIKEEIREGHMEQVTAMLGRPLSITGKVQKGKQLGRTIGFPTANLNAPDNKILPPNGVYAVRVRWLDGAEDADDPGDSGKNDRARVFFGVTNIGCRPTFDDGEHRTVETYVFDFHGNLYGKEISVDLCHFIRPEQKFENAEALARQMHCDEEKARRLFAPFM